MSFHVPERFRARMQGLAAINHAGAGNNGVFFIPNPNGASTLTLRVICSDQMGWEHVSVSCKSRTPTWAEMSYVKDLFWDEEDAVMQLHPPRSTWVNNHPHCLHLWRPLGASIPLPPPIMVGMAGVGQL